MVYLSLRDGLRRRPRVIAVAAAMAVTATIAGCDWFGSDADDATVVVEANLNEQVAKIGGATQDVRLYSDAEGNPWTLYSMANRLAATPVGVTKGVVAEISLPGYIQRITPVTYDGRSYALVSMGGKGLAVVDITDPTAMVHQRTMSVAYSYGPVSYVDGGGNLVADALFSGTAGTVNDVLVDDGSNSDPADDELFIANASFGIQKTKLSNLIGATSDGVLVIDGPQQLTLKYAGENPWGGPLSLKMHGGRLYAALGVLGLGIYNPATLARTGFYNLYTDTSTREDRFGFADMKPSDPGVLNTDATLGLPASGLDADGMLTWQEAAYELQNKQDVASYPWAAFDRYGKYYYNARSLDLVDLPGGVTMAYIAYSLGGLVAVDVTDPANTDYIGYVPAAPAHGPDEPPTQVDKRSILSHFGSGMLKESGVMAVRVVADPADPAKFRAYFTDHFAGVVVVSGAENPASHWKNGGGSFNNNTNPKVLWPDYEFVTSYDMTPEPVGDETMPKFLVADANGNYTAPVMLATGEINGHGGSLFMLSTMNVAAAGQVDLVQSSGAGGVSFIDFVDLTTAGVAVSARFAVPVSLASTNEIGADEYGLPMNGAVAIGHAEGVAVSGNHLYLADGPHGMSVWRVASGPRKPLDDIHLVANTLMSEYPLNDILPTPHAFGVAFGADPDQAYVLSQSLGLRRVDVSAVTSGTAAAGAPSLLPSLASGIFEHSTEAGGNLGGINGQDHAYGVTFYGKYAIVADGGNGLTVYDTTVDTTTGTHVVANIGNTTSGKPPLGRTQSVKLWTDKNTGHIYAVASAGPYGVTVVDMTDLLVNDIKPGMTLIKTFEPIKLEEEEGELKVGRADGKSVDVHIVGNLAYVSYDSFGLVSYAMADLIKPIETVDPLCTDPTKLFDSQTGLDCRPVALGRFKLQLVPGYETVDGGAQFMTPQILPAFSVIRDGTTGSASMLSTTRVLFFVAYGDAGVVKLDWTDPANPVLVGIQDTVGTATATAVANGRVYVADGAGGLVVFK